MAARISVTPLIVVLCCSLLGGIRLSEATAPFGLAAALRPRVWCGAAGGRRHCSTHSDRVTFPLACSMWPKSIFVDILENAEDNAAGSSDNLNGMKPEEASVSLNRAHACNAVVSYRRVRHADRRYGIDAIPVEAVAPLQVGQKLASQYSSDPRSLLCLHG